MFTFSPHHVISVKVGFLLSKTVYDTKFIVNLTHNDSHKRQKCHIIALCFSLSARVNRVSSQETSHDSMLPMIYLQSSSVQTSVKGYIQLFTNEKTIYKPKTENFKCLTGAC